MKITLIQLSIDTENAERTFQQAEQCMAEADASDLYLLPEMWATGFCTQPTAQTAAIGLRALALMQTLAAKHQAAVGGSLAVLTTTADGALAPAGADWPGCTTWRNRFFFVLPNGHYAYYDKRHLFHPAGEHHCFTPGTRHTTVEWRGARFRLLTCFDLRFPESSRNVADAPYEVLLYVAGWPAQRQAAWEALLPARAIENQAFAVGVNPAYHAAGITYAGGSAAYSPLGAPIAQAGCKAGHITFTIQPEAATQLQRDFPILPYKTSVKTP